MEPQLLPLQESIRASCERCRAKKLACVVSKPESTQEVGQQCNRCIRAKLACVFSRRAQNRKSRNAPRRTHDEQTKYTAPPASVDILCDPHQLAGIGGALVSSEFFPNPSVDPAAFHTSGLHLHEQELPPIVNDTLHAYMGSFREDESGFLQLPAPENHSAMSSLPSTAASSCPTPVFTSASSRSEDSFYDERSTSVHFLSVSVLVAEIHEQIGTLRGDIRIPSLCAAEESLEKYSVGQVLGLTRKLATQLRGFWQPELSIHATRRDIPDTATNLLLMTGYASLSQLYTVVFNQIYNSIDQFPECSPEEPSEGPGAMEACTSVYTTVQMLLDEFQAVEDIFSFLNLQRFHLSSSATPENLPDEQQRQLLERSLNIETEWLRQQTNLVRAGLAEDLSRSFGFAQQSEWNSPLQHGHHLKGLLRDRMGL